MSIGEIERQEEREEIFLNLIEKEFINTNIVELIEPGYKDGLNRIRLEVLVLSKTTQLSKRAIIFQPEKPLMIDQGNDYKRIFRSGIIKAKEIFSDPPQKDKITQGTLVLNSDKVTFSSH